VSRYIYISEEYYGWEVVPEFLMTMLKPNTIYTTGVSVLASTTQPDISPPIRAAAVSYFATWNHIFSLQVNIAALPPVAKFATPVRTKPPVLHSLFT
jgi:hypothetical protein